MEYFKIDGRAYDVLVTELEENFNILYSENTGRTISEGAEMYLEPIGTFIGHKVTVARKRGYEQVFDELYEYMSVPRKKGMLVQIAHNQSVIEYEAYVSNGARKLVKIGTNGILYWGALTLNIVPMKAQVQGE